jgi:hypothetical protein
MFERVFYPFRTEKEYFRELIKDICFSQTLLAFLMIFTPDKFIKISMFLLAWRFVFFSFRLKKLSVKMKIFNFLMIILFSSFGLMLIKGG